MNQGRNKRTGRRVPRLLQHICPTSTNETDPSRPWNNPRQRELVSKQLSFIPFWDWYCRFENSTPPVIPDYARMRWYVRAPTSQELLAFVERVKKCLEWDFLASAHSFTSSLIHLFQSCCVSDILQDVITNRTFILRFTPKPSPRFVFPFYTEPFSMINSTRVCQHCWLAIWHIEQYRWYRCFYRFRKFKEWINIYSI